MLWGLLLWPVGSAVAASHSPCEAGALAQATVPVPPSIPSVLKDNQRVLQSLPAKVDTVLVGDSITRRWPDDALRSAFPQQVVFNYGMESDQTQNVLWRLNAPELQQVRPRMVVLLIGTNNLSAGAPSCAIVAGINAIVAKIDALWAKPVIRIIDILPSGEGGGFRQSERLQVDAGIASMLRRRGSGSARNVDQVMTCAGAATCGNYLPDHLHLTPAGYQVLRSAIR